MVQRVQGSYVRIHWSLAALVSYITDLPYSWREFAIAHLRKTMSVVKEKGCAVYNAWLW